MGLSKAHHNTPHYIPYYRPLQYPFYYGIHYKPSHYILLQTFPLSPYYLPCFQTNAPSPGNAASIRPRDLCALCPFTQHHYIRYLFARGSQCTRYPPPSPPLTTHSLAPSIDTGHLLWVYVGTSRLLLPESCLTPLANLESGFFAYCMYVWM